MTGQPGAALPIADEDELYRRIHRDFRKIDQSGRIVLSSQSFTDEEMSVDWARQCTIEDCVKRSPPNIGWIAALQTGAVRRLKPAQQVVHDPLEGNFAHALVIGRKPKALCRALAEMAIIKATLG